MAARAGADIEALIRVLQEAERTATAVGPVSGLVEGGLSIEDAHRICETAIARRVAAGDPIAGFKVGFTNIAVREKQGLPDSTYGYLLRSMVLQTGVRLPMSEFVAPRIETELCLRLGRDLTGPDPSVATVLEAVDGVAASFEICDARIRDWKCPYADFFADNGFSARIVLAKDWRPASSVDLLAETVVLDKDGERIAEGRGENAMGHPAKAVAWLARRLSERGIKLQAGMVVMTGTLTPILPIVAGSTYVATFATLGRIETRFLSR